MDEVFIIWISTGEYQERYYANRVGKGELKAISPAKRLILILRFLATGEIFRSLSFQFRILKLAISYIVQEVFRAIIANLACTYLKYLAQIVSGWKLLSSSMIAEIFQMLSVLLMESLSPSKSLMVAVRLTIITSTHILLFFGSSRAQLWMLCALDFHTCFRFSYVLSIFIVNDHKISSR